MKRSVGIILVVAFDIFAVAGIIHDFISSNGFHYFSEQPHRLLFVAAIGIVGGLAAFGFSVLSPRLQRGVKLVALGSGGSFAIVAGGYFIYQVASLPKLIDTSLPRHMPWLLLVATVAIAGLCWLEFYQVWRSRDRVA